MDRLLVGRKYAPLAPPGALLHIYVGIEFTHNFCAYNLLEHVLQGDDAGKDSILVDDCEEVFAPLKEFFQQLVDADQLGHGMNRSFQIGKSGMVAAVYQFIENIPAHNQADYLVFVLVVQGNAAVSPATCLLPCFNQVQVAVEGKDYVRGVMMSRARREWRLRMFLITRSWSGAIAPDIRPMRAMTSISSAEMLGAASAFLVMMRIRN